MELIHNLVHFEDLPNSILPPYYLKFEVILFMKITPDFYQIIGEMTIFRLILVENVKKNFIFKLLYNFCKVSRNKLSLKIKKLKKIIIFIQITIFRSIHENHPDFV